MHWEKTNSVDFIQLHPRMLHKLVQENIDLLTDEKKRMKEKNSS